jgi:hypothetical protein
LSSESPKYTPEAPTLFVEINMEYILNELLVGYLNDGIISVNEMKALVALREFVNRVATSNYIEPAEIERIRNEFGTEPSVTTWGDYFQTELALDKIRGMADDLVLSVETVKFDILSSYYIFNGKDAAIFEWIDDNYRRIQDSADSDLDDSREEIEHLKVLKDYYTSLNLTDRFTAVEKAWYEDFREACAV